MGVIIHLKFVIDPKQVFLLTSLQDDKYKVFLTSISDIHTFVLNQLLENVILTLSGNILLLKWLLHGSIQNLDEDWQEEEPDDELSEFASDSDGSQRSEGKEESEEDEYNGPNELDKSFSDSCGEESQNKGKQASIVEDFKSLRNESLIDNSQMALVQKENPLSFVIDSINVTQSNSPFLKKESE